jgi:hypothetical protein
MYRKNIKKKKEKKKEQNLALLTLFCKRMYLGHKPNQSFFVFIYSVLYLFVNYIIFLYLYKICAKLLIISLAN